MTELSVAASATMIEFVGKCQTDARYWRETLWYVGSRCDSRIVTDLMSTYSRHSIPHVNHRLCLIQVLCDSVNRERVVYEKSTWTALKDTCSRSETRSVIDPTDAYSPQDVLHHSHNTLSGLYLFVTLSPQTGWFQSQWSGSALSFFDSRENLRTSELVSGKP